MCVSRNSACGDKDDIKISFILCELNKRDILWYTAQHRITYIFFNDQNLVTQNLKSCFWSKISGKLTTDLFIYFTVIFLEFSHCRIMKKRLCRFFCVQIKKACTEREHSLQTYGSLLANSLATSEGCSI